MHRPASIKKQAQIDAYLLNNPLTPGEQVTYINDRGSKDDGIIVKIINDMVTIKNYYKETTVQIPQVRRSTRHIGANPFVVQNDVRSYSYTIEQILSNFDLLPGWQRTNYEIDGIPLMEVNFDPFVIIDGSKQYFQRPLVWTLEDKQLLIDSIYNSLSCGSVLVRKNEWEELEKLAKTGEQTLSFIDVIDGKQRLNAIAEFVNDDFPDSHGNYFSDLCDSAQYNFLNSTAFTYKVISRATDKQILQEFLKVNFSGVPQSKEHIEFVADLFNKM